jgi:FkbM family methyltransferase
MVSRPEQDGKLATLADLRACYRLFLDRRPDERGFRSFASVINREEMTVTDLSKLFLASPEFRHRLADALEWSSGLPDRVELRDGGYLYVSSTDSVIGADIKQTGEYEPLVVDRMRAVLQPGMTFVDVGASFGFYTVLAATAVGPKGKVIAFEPGPQNRSMLLLNIAAHEFRNVRFYPVALSDENGVLLYYTSGGNGAITAFTGQVSDLGSGELVAAARLDDLLEHEDRIDVMKIDVEGAEGRVIGGGSEVLRRHRPVLFFEFSPPSLHATSGRSGREFLEELQGLNYSFEILDSDKSRGIFVGIDAVLERFEARDSDHLDILARVPSE